MESTNPNSLFAEYIKVIKQFKLPGVDASAILESRRKDIEALAAANTTALTGMQELAETAYRAQADSYAVISKRVAENVEELKALLQSAT